MTPSVLIMNHLEKNLPYLEQAVKNHIGNDYPVTVISSAETAPKIQGVDVIHSPQLNTATAKMNHFFSKTTRSHALVQSDDVIVSPNIIEAMTRAAANVPCPLIQTPLSNNEEGSRFISYGGNWLNLRDKTIEEYPTMSLPQSGQPVLIPVEWFAFYCAFIPTDVFLNVGIDENLENRYNDVDFCLRARQLGVLSCINAGAFAFHYGSRTLREIVTPAMYAEADAYWAKKIGAV